MRHKGVDPLEIIRKYYAHDSVVFPILVEHSRMVIQKSLEIAKGLKDLGPDIAFIEEAAMLHDIGIFMTNSPIIGCFGEKRYICHGYLGRELLENEGLPVHALVCERHVGVGLSAGDIDRQALPLPKRDMLPDSIEEKIICYADKFFSKKAGEMHREKSLPEVRQDMLRYGEGHLRRFDEMHDSLVNNLLQK